jgi:hypothetical protein
MTNKNVASALAVAGVVTWLFPGFNGYFFDASDVSAGEAQIAGAVLLSGAAIVWFIRK